MYFGPSISVGRRGVSYGDSDAQAFIAATGLTGTTEVNAVNNLVANLKSYGLWSKMKAIYPFVSDTYNQFSYTEDLTNAAWQKTTTVATPNATIAPDGTNTGWSITGGNIRQQIATAGTYAYTCYVKKKTNRYFFCTIYVGGVDNVVWGDLDTGTITLTQNNVSNASLTSVANGWYKLTFNFNATAVSPEIWLPMCCTASGSFTRGTDIFVWHPQFELGSSFSNYQPIATTPANRFVSQFKYNLKDPRDLDAAFRLAFNGTWAYSKQGATPNGVSGFANTFLNPTSVFGSKSLGIGVYVNTATTFVNDKHPIGAYSGGTNYSSIQINSGNGMTFNMYSASATSMTASPAAIGHMYLNNNGTTTYAYVNRQTSNGVTNGTDRPNVNISIGGINVNGTTSNFVNNQFCGGYVTDYLNATESDNLYISMQQFNSDLSRQYGVPIVSDADAQSFLNAAQITDLTQANAINTLVVGLKNASLWTKMKAIYPFVGGTATTHKWNLKDPRDLDAAYRLAFFGAWTHSSTGALPNGTNAYADSFITPSANLNANSTHVSYYSRTNVTTNAGTEIGTWYSGYNYGIELNLYRSVAAQKTAAIINSGGGAAQINGGSITPTTGLLVGSRIANNNGFVSKNGATIGTNTTTVTTQLSTFKIYLGAANNFGTAGAYSNKESAFASIGDGITEAEATTLNTLVTNFETTLGRNV